MTAFLDTNVVVRHLTHDPPDLGERATRFLATHPDLLLPDLIVAEIVYVLESFYEVAAPEAARILRAVLAFPTIRTADPDVLLRALEVHEQERLDFADAYLVACAEVTGVGEVASFDRGLDRIGSITRRSP